jgi:hypothetical protein
MVGQEFSYRYIEGIELRAHRVEWRSDLRASSLLTGGIGSRRHGIGNKVDIQVEELDNFK